MHDLINSIVFGWYPYLVLAMFLIGGWLRFDRTRDIWRRASSRLLDAQLLVLGAVLSVAGISSHLRRPSRWPLDADHGVRGHRHLA